MIYFQKYIFNLSLLALIVLSLFPGSLIGLFLYGDLGQQPNLIKNPFGTTINHFISYLCVSILGLFIYSKTEKFKLVVYQLFFLSIILEVLQFIIPNRAFQLGDLIGNFLGVLVAYFLIKIYLFIRKL
tara:strand:- start:374 stop:757 length:384 start_codon:yes stop_codon:yes gene_type:complete